MNITDKARMELARINPNRLALRVSVVGGGCSGLSYKMEYLDATTITVKGGIVIKFYESEIYIDSKSWLFLQNVTLDFSDGLNGKGFTFVNPEAKRTCGCGESFST